MRTRRGRVVVGSEDEEEDTPAATSRGTSTRSQREAQSSDEPTVLRSRRGTVSVASQPATRSVSAGAPSRGEQKNRRQMQQDNKKQHQQNSNGNVGVEGCVPKGGRERSVRAMLVHDIAHFILARLNKDGVVKKGDVLKAFATHRGAEEMLPKAVAALETTLNLKVDETGEQIRLVGAGQPPDVDVVEFFQNESTLLRDAKQGLLSTILIFLFMKNCQLEPIPYEVLEEFLKELKFLEKKTSPFGDITKLIGPQSTAEFIMRGYLHVTRKKRVVAGSEDIMYEWGDVARKTVDPMRVLRAYCRISGRTTPKQWPEHYKAAKVALSKMGIREMDDYNDGKEDGPLVLLS